MTQDTRKDPRAKVLSMTVRYKSATLDEFIEHHSYDVSRGGMFIKTPSPFPPGTLLKFEVKIAAEQRLIQGVGRVVWKREASEAGEARPAGMGVKFIKIDDESRKVIDQLIEARGDASSAYDLGGDTGVPTRPAASPGAGEATPGPVTVGREQRKATMLGLGSMQPASSAKADPADAFFPHTAAELDMPAAEDRTVMRQAAELLQEALREAGGSLEDVGNAQTLVGARTPAPRPAAGKASVATPQVAETRQQAAARAESSERADAAAEADIQEEKTMLRALPSVIPPVEANSATEDTVVNSRRRRSAAAAEASAAAAKASGGSSRSAETQPGRASTRPGGSQAPQSRSAALSEAAGAAADGGGGRLMMVLGAVAAAAGLIFFLTRSDAEPPADPVAAEAPVQAVPTPPVADPLPPLEAPSTPPAEPVAPAAAAASTAPSVAGAAGAAAAAVSPSAPPGANVAARRPKPKPAAPPPSATDKEEAGEGEPAPRAKSTLSLPPAPTLTPGPGAPPPPMPPAEPTPTAKPTPAPAPKTQPADPGGDNPY